MPEIKLYILALIILLSSCNILQTRNPQSPKISRSSFKPSITPEILFANLKNAFAQKNSEGYKACFVEDPSFNSVFKFIPSSTAAAADPALLKWDLKKEQQYFFNLVQSNEKSEIELLLKNEDWNTLGEQRVYKYDYTIILDLPLTQKMYSGTSRFQIQLDAKNQWVIAEWIDIQTSKKQTWSDLKGTYY